MATPHGTSGKVKTTQPHNPELTLGIDTGPHLPLLAFARILPADVFLFQVDVLVAGACLGILAWTQAGALGIERQGCQEILKEALENDDIRGEGVKEFRGCSGFWLG